MFSSARLRLLAGDTEDPINRLSSYAVRKVSPESRPASGGPVESSTATATTGFDDLHPLARLQGLVCADANR